MAKNKKLKIFKPAIFLLIIYFVRFIVILKLCQISYEKRVCLHIL